MAHPGSSDALQILPQALMGYSKTTILLVRGVIENVLRHVYFYDHPVEFARMNLEKDWYVRVRDLFAYIKDHPLYLGTETRFDAIGRLKNLYTEVSSLVHGVKLQHMEMRPGLEGIVLEPSVLNRQAKYVARCAESANFLLAAFHKTVIAKLPLEDQQIVLLTFPAEARKTLAGLS